MKILFSRLSGKSGGVSGTHIGLYITSPHGGRVGEVVS